MVNPFDRNFFHFLFGFVLILCISFSIIIFTGFHKDALDGKAVSVEAKNI